MGIWGKKTDYPLPLKSQLSLGVLIFLLNLAKTDTFLQGMEEVEEVEPPLLLSLLLF